MSPAVHAARHAVPTAVALTALLALAELGLLPPLRVAWALNLWQYLPAPIVVLLAAATLALCWPSTRRKLVRVVTQRPRALQVPRTATGIATFVLGTAAVLWIIRERRLYGDSSILLYNAATGAAFLFPDIGATFLFRLCHRLGAALGTSGQTVLQVAVSVAGGAAVYSFARAAELLAPSPPRALLVLLLVLGGGLLRVLAGHVEVYAFLLLCAGAYFWSALEHLRGRCSIAVPALAFGFGLWMHLSFSFLAPSLLVLTLQRGTPPKSVGALVAQVFRAALIAAAPVAAFLILMVVLGNHAELAQAWETLLRWSGVEPSPVGHEAFLRSPFGPSGAGTRYAILSWGHLKYLTNAFVLLVPAAVPIAATFLVGAPRRFVATSEAAFLTAGAFFMVLYALVVRPVWGPYDWDLFSLTAATLALLAAHLLVQAVPEPPLAELAIVVVTATLLLVTVPFLMIGISPAHDAGPFAYGLTNQPGESPIDAFERQLGPWL